MLNESTANLIKDFEDNKDDTFKNQEKLDNDKYAFGTNKIYPSAHKYSKFNTNKVNPFLVDDEGDDISASNPKLFAKQMEKDKLKKKEYYIKGDRKLEYLRGQGNVPELQDSDSNFFSETGIVFRGLHAVFETVSFSDPYNPAVIRICILFIRIMGYAFFQSFLYQKSFLEIESLANMNSFVRGCLVYPACTIFLNMILIWVLELLQIKKVHWIYYHYFLFLAQNEERDEDFINDVLEKARNHIVKRVLLVVFINMFFISKLTNESFRETFSESNYLVLGSLVAILIDLGIMENYKVCYAVDQVLKAQRYFVEKGVMKPNLKQNNRLIAMYKLK